MASRYGPSVHARERDPYERQRSELFAGRQYDRYSPSPAAGGGYGYSAGLGIGAGGGGGGGQYRAATPNRKGQYSASVLEELEAQNDEAVEGLSAKVRMLKDITVAIGDEVRSSSTLIEAMNERFEGTRERLAGTMKNMLRMASRGTGVGWRSWLLFIAAVMFVFWWVWI